MTRVADVVDVHDHLVGVLLKKRSAKMRDHEV